MEASDWLIIFVNKSTDWAITKAFSASYSTFDSAFITRGIKAIALFVVKQILLFRVMKYS